MADDAFHELRVGFTAAVSHELRTPLARLLALIDSAQLPGAETQELLTQARDEVEAMSELIDDVLFLSELETERAVVALGATPVGPVAQEVVEQLTPAAERAGMRLTLDVGPSAAVPLRARMVRVLVENLLANAIRYAGDGSNVTVSAGREDATTTVLRVADDGVGVPDEELPRLFERFYRGDRARTTHGTGLGLAIVKHIVLAAGGDVEARRPPGGGLEIACSFTSS